jgi:hypothetical protein
VEVGQADIAGGILGEIWGEIWGRNMEIWGNMGTDGMFTSFFESKQPK